MPHNNIFGRDMPTSFEESRFQNGFDGQPKGNNFIGMKRKETWFELEAGNFEMQRECRGGPTPEKRVRISPEDSLDVQDHSLPNIGESATNGASIEPQFCQSMVTHMTMSFSNGANPAASNQSLNAASHPTKAAQEETSCDIEMDCGITEGDQNALQQKPQEICIDDTCYRSAAAQELNTSKSHFYIYRCKPQYCAFH